MSEIRLENLRKEFGSLVAVRDVSITFPTSTVTCLLGPSGCGKTTLMRMIAGLEESTSGDIYFDNDRVTDLSPQERNIGMVFQYPVVYKGITVFRNIELPLMEENLSDTERHTRVSEVIEILGLEDSAQRDVSLLDNGTRQKVAVARAVARQPRIILFDEPITNVDVEARVQLKRALKDLTKQHKQTIVYVTHDQTEAMTLADEIALMHEGEIVQRDAPRTLYNHPQNVFGGWFLGNPGMNFFEMATNDSEKATALLGPLGSALLNLSEASTKKQITVGIRPEHVRILKQANATAVKGEIARKAVVVGGQYLITINLNGSILKAKVTSELGRDLQGEVWIEYPPERVIVFDEAGKHIDIPQETFAQLLP
jgi:ABC-type sugar transport system ATPase subunit